MVIILPDSVILYSPSLPIMYSMEYQSYKVLIDALQNKKGGWMVALCSLPFTANESPNFMNCTSQISAEPRHFTPCCCPCPCINHHCASIRLQQLQSWVSCLQSCFLQSVLHTVSRLVFLNTDDFYISLLKTINMTLMLWGWNPNSLICLQNFPSSAVSCLTLTFISQTDHVPFQP